MALGRFDEFGSLVTEDVDEEWSDHFYPPNFENNMELRDRLEEILLRDVDDDPDKMRSLEEFVEVCSVGYLLLHPPLPPPPFPFLLVIGKLRT